MTPTKRTRPEGHFLSSSQLFIAISKSNLPLACTFHNFYRYAKSADRACQAYVCTTCFVHLDVRPSPLDPDAVSGKCIIDGAPFHFFHAKDTSAAAAGAELDQETTAECTQCHRSVVFTTRLPIIHLASIKHYSAREAERQTETLYTWARYLRDMQKQRRPINAKNPNFGKAIGLDEHSHYILMELGFQYDYNRELFEPLGSVNSKKIDYALQEVDHQRWKKEGSPGDTGNWPNFTSATPELCSFLDAKLFGETGSQMVIYAKSMASDDKARFFEMLGVNRDAADPELRWVYGVLTKEDPLGLPRYLEALSKIAVFRSSNDLQEFVAMEKSKGISFASEVDAAYALIGMGATANSSDRALMAAFTTAATERAHMEGDLKEALRMVAVSRDSPVLQHYLETGEIYDLPDEESSHTDLPAVDASNLPAGLENIGNTCYLNSLLQMYFSIRELREAVLEFEPPPAAGSDWNVPNPSPKEPSIIDSQESIVDLTSPTLAANETAGASLDVMDVDAAPSRSTDKLSRVERSYEFIRELRILFASMIWTNQSSITPSKKVAEIALNSENLFGQQQDVSESMANILDLLELGFKSIDADAVKHGALVKRLFFGNTKQSLTYTDQSGKEQRSEKDEEFNHLIVDVSESLSTSLDAFFAPTQVELEGVKAQRELCITNMPPILTLQIRRVRFNRETNQAYKQNDYLRFDRTISLHKYVSAASSKEDLEYTLHAVFTHSGQANFGHYLTCMWDADMGRWLKYNDSYVTEIPETEVFSDTTGSTANAYALVYVKAKGSALSCSLSFASKVLEETGTQLIEDDHFFCQESVPTLLRVQIANARLAKRTLDLLRIRPALVSITDH